MLKRITLGIMMLGLVVATTGCETTPAQDGAILGTALGRLRGDKRELSAADV